MKKIIDRLAEYIELKDISLNAFDKSLGMSNGYIGKQIKNKASIGGDIIEKISCIYTDLSIDWLITGKGEILREVKATKLYKENGTVNKIEESSIATKANGEVVMIPLVTVAAVAGFGNADFAIQKSDVKDYYVVPKFKDRRVDFMIEVAGSSMYPKYSPGDIVACTILRESKFIQWNKVHVIGTIEQGILIKRVKKGADDNQLLLISDNKDYDPFTISTNEITGMAIVIGVIRLE